MKALQPAYRKLALCIMVFVFISLNASCGQSSQVTATKDPAATPTPTPAVKADEPYLGDSYLNSHYSTTQSGKTVDEVIDAINPVMPESLGEIELGNYKGIRISVPEKEIVTDETVDRYIEEYVLPHYKSLLGDKASDSGDIIIDDSAVKLIDPSFTTLSQYRSHLFELLKQNAEYEDYLNLSYAAVNSVISDSKITPSEDAVNWQIDYYLKSYAQEIKENYSGMSFDELVTLYGTTYEDYRLSLRDYAVESVCQMLVMDAVADKEKIEVSQKDIEDYASNHGLTVEALQSVATDEEILSSVRRELAVKVIIDNADVVRTAPKL